MVQERNCFKKLVSPDDGSEVDVFFVRVDAELELVIASGLDDGRVAGVQLAGVQVIRELLVL